MDDYKKYLPHIQRDVDPDTKNVIGSNRWDKKRHDEVLDTVKDFYLATNDLGEFTPTGFNAMGDTYLSLVKAMPNLKKNHEIRPSYLINRAVLEELLGMDDYQQLRTYSIGDTINAALTATSLEPKLELIFDKLKKAQEKAKEMEKKLQELAQMAAELIDLDELIDAANAAGEGEGDGGEGDEDGEGMSPQEQKALIEEQMRLLQSQLDDDTGDLEDILEKELSAASYVTRGAVADALKEQGENAASFDGWGLAPGGLKKLPVEKRLEMAKKLSSEKFRKMAEVFGALIRAAISAQTTQNLESNDEIYDIELGDDLHKVLPTELLALGDETLMLEFFRRFTEHSLSQYALKGTEQVQKGGIILLEDGSGSMSGSREIWAKGIGTALLKIASMQNRPFYGVHFGGTGEFKTFDYDTSGPTITCETEYRKTKESLAGIEAILSYVETFFGGGPVDRRERVVTPDGWKPIGSICVGDIVYGPDGKPTEVIGVYPQGILEGMYRVTFKDGATLMVDRTHLWTVYDRTVNGYNFKDAKLRTITLQQIIDDGIRANHNGWRFSVPITQPVEYPEKDFPLDPYLVGYILGNGGLTSQTPDITSQAGDEVEWMKLLPTSVIAKNKEHREGGCPSYSISSPVGQKNELTEALRSLNMMGCDAFRKFIPEQYMLGSVEQRWSLLQGLCDSDGSYDKPGRAEYNSVSESLSLGVQELARSLGCLATITPKDTPRENESTIYRVSISVPMGYNPFRLERKRNSWRDRSNSPVRSIVSIEPIADADCVCIKVDREDGLFLTEGFVVTHNTDFTTPLSIALARMEQEYKERGACG
jgi:uncharacterized protein with von Willebrand factor type A (vWA) domain